MNLFEEQVDAARQTISSDGYPMSIGELTNLYRDGELVIRPEFQRFYRWSRLQKSRLVESILLGIPLPSIFVAQSGDGKWELVDGLQRVSTILELQGELVSDTTTLPPLVLEETKYLPSLEGRLWISQDEDHSFTEAQRLDFKRSKIDIKIIKRDSSAQTKYDLFQRLNSYGSTLNPQEIRSAMLVSVSPEFFAWVEELARYPSFVNSVDLSERLLEERYDVELVLRFLVLHQRDQSLISQTNLRNFNSVLDDESIHLAEAFPLNKASLEVAFKTVFDLVDKNGGDRIFKRWDTITKSSKGSFLLSSFELIAMGLGFHVAQSGFYRTDLLDLVEEMWKMDQLSTGFATGKSTEARLCKFLPLGRALTKA